MKIVLTILMIPFVGIGFLAGLIWLGLQAGFHGADKTTDQIFGIVKDKSE